MKFPIQFLSLGAVALASCAAAQSPDSVTVSSEQKGPFSVASAGTFDEPWAIAFAPGTQVAFITEKAGTMKFIDLASGQVGTVTGLPKVQYGGQGGLGDVAFLASEASATVSRRTIYLTWADPGENGASAAAMGRGTIVCDAVDRCHIDSLTRIWRQQPEIRSPGHFSHKIAFSPDGKYLFLSSGERMQGAPAQALDNNLGKVLRLNLDGTPAAGNPFEGRGGVAREIWSYGHRNLLGLRFDLDGQLWDVEHGPRGGDEINMVEPGNNYGWPVRSNGINYDGSPIPDHSPDDGFTKPAISWTPVIAPGDFLFYSGKLWPEWKNQALITGLATQSLVRVRLTDGKGTEESRTDFGQRLRDIVEAPDGSLYVIEDGKDGRLLHLTPAK